MKSKTLLFSALAILVMSFTSKTADKTDTQAGDFNIEEDLLLVQYDSKTDVDDLHTIAGFATLLSDADFSEIKYHAVAGAYGIQEGLYVPPNDLFQLAFGNNWTDAHNNSKAAVEKVTEIAKTTLNAEGDIWIAEAGQSDFSAKLIKAIQKEFPEINTKQRIHLVQHSNWNEESTSPESLKFVKDHTNYHKIPDGNEVGNGTPGFRDPDYTQWKAKIKNPKLIEIWQLATDLANKYNGKDGRYNNEAISAGGMDFSDLAEVCWILGLENIEDTAHFFNLYAN
ncbi:hypothetical protein [Salegentibacter salegens]|uniref:DUF4886 domain-containing protein n=1 Tax=Salegentibacter salegens TaxID=143223 RepID=A0A1M7K4W7_9FLAO|nr:hypothetical protein [Salegentibacter salegens]PRX38891.1 hypothetical protein LY58_03431 [Salegentibacter salegens]SHM60033.1 hypothetical protein SAMN05878281_1239 [Salegentibacter salegens]